MTVECRHRQTDDGKIETSLCCGHVSAFFFREEVLVSFFQFAFFFQDLLEVRQSTAGSILENLKLKASTPSILWNGILQARRKCYF